MRTLTRWSPFRELARYDPFGDLGYLWKELPAPSLLTESEPSMRMDVSEHEGAYLVKAEIPGVAKDEITVSIDGNVVTITAEVKREKDAKEGEKVLRTERYYGAVSRTLTLPADVDVAKADAGYDNGVLTLTLPKKAGGEAKTLPVH
jgi:HSP20 family protein